MSFRDWRVFLFTTLSGDGVENVPWLVRLPRDIGKGRIEVGGDSVECSRDTSSRCFER